ncbi:ElyC/SanA/YdcF family protein [Butyrivibrio sp. VCD2006]|uniref:ElyC/SanA/YdcF family protein n=1 Tax=Butyrivibrio sp. VCD2006 TaxID=1280664 RepID=UPI0003FFA740|nr:ElyC/SanA/YdcF family protein [Butyrivibrio sp. VCD2006]
MENRTEGDIQTAINTLGRFCGKRDIRTLDRDQLYDTYGIYKADVMVLFGGSILAGGDVFAKAIKDELAETFIIVGGAGHTTDTLRNRVHSEYPFIKTAGLTEAEIFQQYLQKVHNCQADLLETESTNCGNNITNLLSLLNEKHIHFQNIILCQDETMQARMDAVLRKYTSDSVKIINYAAYAATVCASQSGLTYTEDIHGMWDIDRYIELLMGEIPRLTDDENGYGPNGKRFLAHVEIPDKVRLAFEKLKTTYGKQVREANPLFASKETV